MFKGVSLSLLADRPLGCLVRGNEVVGVVPGGQRLAVCAQVGKLQGTTSTAAVFDSDRYWGIWGVCSAPRIPAVYFIWGVEGGGSVHTETTECSLAWETGWTQTSPAVGREGGAWAGCRRRTTHVPLLE